MKNKKFMMALPCFAILQGCAGYLNAWTNDPFQRHKVKSSTIYTMTGDRRTAVFNDRNSSMKYCAESLPDAISALASSSSATINAQGLKGGDSGQAGFSDSNVIALLPTFQRTEIAELSRQLGWSTCLAWSQGAITNEQYHEILKEIVAGSLDVMKARASQIPPVQPAPQIVVTPVIKPDPKAESPTSNTNTTR